MAAQIGKYAANKMLKKQMKDYQGKKVEGGEVSHEQLCSSWILFGLFN